MTHVSQSSFGGLTATAADHFAQPRDGSSWVRRTAGISVGVVTQATFLVTVWYLFWFLYGQSVRHASGSLWIDLWLAVQFCIPHSGLLLPAVRSRLERVIPSAFYGSVYCLVTCASLLGMFALWNRSPVVVWQFTGIAAIVVRGAFYASWVGLFYSLSLTGLGYQTGWTTWWHWLRRRPAPRREFHPRSLYRLLRHPVYLSFWGLIVFTPTVTLDRLLLIVVWTCYIAIGSVLKDRRLEFYLGDTYRAYAARVAGYPGVMAGPLARWSLLVKSAKPPPELRPNETPATVISGNSRRAA